MNLEDLLTKLQAERKVWQDREETELIKTQASTDAQNMAKHLRQADYDKGVAWGLYLATTLILQEQLESKSAGELLETARRQANNL